MKTFNLLPGTYNANVLDIQVKGSYPLWMPKLLQANGHVMEGSEVNEATIVIRAKDFGAHGRLTATVKLVNRKGEVEVRAVYDVLGTFYVPLP